MGQQQGLEKRSGIARVKEAEESRERLKQLLTTLREVQAERAEVSSALQAEELAVLDTQLALDAEMKKKEESFKKYRLEVVSVTVQERLAGSTPAGGFKGDGAVKGKNGRGGGRKVDSFDRGAAEKGEGGVNGGGGALRKGAHGARFVVEQVSLAHSRCWHGR
eukprot:6174101-Pleurochrysis_carterae.AAC.3